MKKTSFLKHSDVFEGYEVQCKLSTSHEGEREVYLVSDTNKRCHVLTLFNLSHGRYACKNNDCTSVEEIALCSRLQGEAFARLRRCGVASIGRRRFAWMTQAHIEANTLDEEMRLQSGLSRTDTLIVARKVLEALRELTAATGGGGHFNLSPSHVLVDYSGDDIESVYLIGLSMAGECRNGDGPDAALIADAHFAPPEVTRGYYGYPTDIYSLGMLMVYMLGGKNLMAEFDAPIEGTASDFRRAVLEKVRQTVPQNYMLVLGKTTDPNLRVRLSSHKSFGGVLDLLEKKEREGRMRIPSGAGTEPALNAGSKSAAAVNTGKTKTPANKTGGLEAVAGMSELKARLRRDFVDIVKNTGLARTYGIQPPNGILLYGAPGCGKTFIAEKIAVESGLNYRMVNPSQLGSIYVHGSQAKIAEAFEEAAKNAPTILIFDEFDAVAPSRDNSAGNNQANEVNEILTQLNNCADRGIYVICTSNRPDMIDPAVLRAGRLDAKFYVGLPDAAARRELFALELGRRPCDGSIDLDGLSRAADGFTCGDISYVVKEAARECFDEAIQSADKDVAVPVSQQRLLKIIGATVPSVSPREIKRYQEVKSRMEHTDRENMGRPRLGFATDTK